MNSNTQNDIRLVQQNVQLMVIQRSIRRYQSTNFGKTKSTHIRNISDRSSLNTPEY